MEPIINKAYLETSAINRACEASLDGKQIANYLKEVGYKSVVGLHVIYELAKTYLGVNQNQKAQRCFLIVKDADPLFVTYTKDLLEQELFKLRKGSAILPFPNYHNQVAAKYEISKLAEGVFDAKARNFITAREEDIKQNFPKEMHAYINKVITAKSIKTFDDVLSYFSNQTNKLIFDTLTAARIQITSTEALRLAEDLESFPAIRSNVRANLYLSYICIKHKTVPSRDKIDEPRHLIDASYSKAVVIDDAQLIKVAPCINPDLVIIQAKDIFKIRV